MFKKPLVSMTDRELEQERLLWDDEIVSADRWGDSQTTASQKRDAVEREQHSRRLAKVRAEQIHIRPIVLDDPGVKPRPVSGPVITGSAKARLEARMPRFGIIGAVAFLLACLAVSAVMAGQRLVELDDRYAAMERV